MDNRQIISEIIVQLLGFGIVFFVLKKFAWGRLLEIIDRRRDAIRDEFSGIASKKQDIENLEKDYRLKLDHIEQQARAKIQEAANQGLLLAKDIQDEARQESQRMVHRAKEEIEHEIAKARLTLRDDIVDLSGLMTEKILKEKMSPADHKKLVNQFLKEMENV